MRGKKGRLKFTGKILLSLTPAVLICAGWLLFAQSPSSKNTNSNRNNITDRSHIDAARDGRINNLTALAPNAPPEVAADVLLTIASSSLIGDKQRSIPLINEAFLIAGQAREPFKQRSWGLLVDTRSGFKEAASDLQLDRLSLQSRAVMKMILLDRVRAREMFEEISLPPIEPLTCKDTLVPDLGPYYQAMKSVSEECFTDKEKKASLQIQFLADRIEKIKSIPQLTPAEKMIVSAKASPDELSLLAYVMTRALNRVTYEPRSFAFAIERDVFIPATNQLISKLKQNDVPANDFIDAIRSFLTKNMSGEVCGDTRWIKDGVISIPRGFESINVAFVRPITIDDIHPSRIGPKGDDVTYWSTPKAKAIMEAAKTLRFGDGTSPLPLEQRKSDEWRQKLADFLDLIGNWDPESEASEDDYFQEKCNMYNLLVDLCPEDDQRDIVLRRYARYLKETSGRYKGRMEWILPVTECLRALRSKNETTQKSSLDPWLSSSDTSLRIYAELTMLMTPKN
ncbi:MAG: hypothetical protein ACMG6H_13500 [Acidobacteriota bacterium]